MTLPFGLRLSLVVALAAVCSSRLPAFGATPEVFRPPGAGWSLSIPTGWHSSPEFLQKIVDALSERQITPPDYLLALVPDDGRPVYALVQRLPAPPDGSSYEDVEQSVGTGSELAKSKSDSALKDAFTNVDFGNPTFDRATNRILIKTKATGADGKEILGFTEGTVGKSAIILVHCYAPAALVAESMPEFREIWRTSRFDAGKEFVPGPGLGATAGSAPPAGLHWQPVLLIAIACAIAAVVFRGTRILLRRRESQRD